MTIKLSPDQETAVDSLLRTLRHEPEAVLVGPAGTGKTTTMQAFLRMWALASNRPRRFKEDPICACPTWKAALRFTEVTGLGASSIHGLIYGAPTEKVVGARKELEFNTLSLSNEVSYQLIIVDECSMVSERLYGDLVDWARRHNCKILWIGDREQLEPVNAKWGVDFNNPTAALTQVHRQAEGSDLLDFVTLVRESRVNEFTAYGADVRWVKKVQEGHVSQFWQSAAEVSDQMCITFTNKLRVGQNNIARRALGFQGDPQAGEPLLSFANRGRMVNGEITKVLACSDVIPGDEDDLAAPLASILARGELRLSRVEAQLGAKRITFLMTPGSLGLQGYTKQNFNKDLIALIRQDVSGSLTYKFGKFRSNGPVNERAKRIEAAYDALADVDFGYACTAHKAQGSQWKRIMVLIEPYLRKADGGPAFRRRWLYTAATRAEKELTIGSI